MHFSRHFSPHHNPLQPVQDDGKNGKNNPLCALSRASAGRQIQFAPCHLSALLRYTKNANKPDSPAAQPSPPVLN